GDTGGGSLPTEGQRQRERGGGGAVQAAARTEGDAQAEREEEDDAEEGEGANPIGRGDCRHENRSASAGRCAVTIAPFEPPDGKKRPPLTGVWTEDTAATERTVLAMC